jgi:hypothetical protein
MLVWSCSLANSTSVLEHGSTLHQHVHVVFYSLFGVISDKIWGMIKTITLYQLPGYKTLELVVISEPISSSDNYDPTSIPESSNPVMTEERTHSRAREQGPSRIPVCLCFLLLYLPEQLDFNCCYNISNKVIIFLFILYYFRIMY